jgi:multidrug efflux pump subunit AcrB
LELFLSRRGAVAAGFLVFCAGSWLLITQLGQDFFPNVDSREIRLHLRARTGTRVEETAKLTDEVEKVIRQEIPTSELEGILDNIGIPNSPLNLSYTTSGVIGSGDADVMITLKPNHTPSDEYVHRLRRRLPKEFPNTVFYFLPADIISQILNFGLPAPFDVQIVGRDVDKNREIARRLVERIRKIPGAVDVRIQQPADQPRLRLTVDRTLAAQVGVTERQVANSVLLTLSGSGQTQPAFWLNPVNGINYNLAAFSPQYQIDSLGAIGNIPVEDKVRHLLAVELRFLDAALLGFDGVLEPLPGSGKVVGEGLQDPDRLPDVVLRHHRDFAVSRLQFVGAHVLQVL